MLIYNTTTLMLYGSRRYATHREVHSSIDYTINSIRGAVAESDATVLGDMRLFEKFIKAVNEVAVV